MGGNVYRSTYAGENWEPIFDAQPAQSIGALAVAASDPNVVWAGTGEGKIRSHISVGQGIYKSTDAGKTWTLMGLEQTARIPRIVIDPRNPDVVSDANPDRVVHEPGPLAGAAGGHLLELAACQDGRE